MNEKKAVFIIPGFRHAPKNVAYKQIAKMLKKEGYLPIPIRIPWRETTISENTEYFLKKFKQKLKLYRKKIQKKYILGFSFGAMIAFMASTKVSISGLILCSLSPYYKRDVSKLHCKILSKKVKAKKVHILYGTKEPRLLIEQANKTYRQIPSVHKYLIPIRNTDHNLGDKKYLAEIQKIF